MAVATARSLTLPFDWTPRDYQAEAFQALDQGIKRVLSVWHRRSGKDTAGLNYIAKSSQQRVGNYWHLYPTAKQGRKALWERIEDNGRRVIDQAVPEPMRDGPPRQDEMLIRTRRGSTIQVCGAEQVDSLVGSNPVGIVMSEYSLTNPKTIDFILPILIQNKGWLWINGTPRGKNHFYKLLQQNKDNPEWFCSVKRWQDTGVITQADIDSAIRGGMLPEFAEQEFGCSFEAPNIGVVYAAELAQLMKDRRIDHLPYDPNYPVETWWDIGHRDATAIWFVQKIGGWNNVIDYIEDTGKGLPFFSNELNKKPYSYSRHVGPHDLGNVVWVADETTKTIAANNYGINYTIAPKIAVNDGVAAMRRMLARCRFDTIKCNRIIQCLEQYQYEYDDDTMLRTKNPAHDWSSHCMDAGRYGAVTPAYLGLVADWAKRELATSDGMGHNGGPPMDDADDYDPLAAFRAHAH